MCHARALACGCLASCPLAAFRVGGRVRGEWRKRRRDGGRGLRVWLATDHRPCVAATRCAGRSGRGTPRTDRRAPRQPYDYRRRRYARVCAAPRAAVAVVGAPPAGRVLRRAKTDGAPSRAPPPPRPAPSLPSSRPATKLCRGYPCPSVGRAVCVAVWGSARRRRRARPRPAEAVTGGRRPAGTAARPPPLSRSTAVADAPSPVGAGGGGGATRPPPRRRSPLGAGVSAAAGRAAAALWARPVRPCGCRCAPTPLGQKKKKTSPPSFSQSQTPATEEHGVRRSSSRQRTGSAAAQPRRRRGGRGGRGGGSGSGGSGTGAAPDGGAHGGEKPRGWGRVRGAAAWAGRGRW